MAVAAEIAPASLVWLTASGGDSVSEPVVGGKTCDGDELHCARVQLEKELSPGKLHIGHSCGYFPYYGVEEHADEYEVLSNPGCIDLEWVAASEGDVPIGAVEAGLCEEGQPIYIARANHEGDLIPGKLVPRTNLAYVSWGGGEHCYGEYQVLCVKAVKPISGEC